MLTIPSYNFLQWNVSMALILTAFGWWYPEDIDEQYQSTDAFALYRIFLGSLFHSSSSMGSGNGGSCALTIGTMGCNGYFPVAHIFAMVGITLMPLFVSSAACRAFSTSGLGSGYGEIPKENHGGQMIEIEAQIKAHRNTCHCPVVYIHGS